MVVNSPLPYQEIEIPSSQIGSADAGPLSIREVQVGQVSIDKVTMKNFSGKFDYNSGTMENTEVRVVLQLHLDYWWGVCIDIGFGNWCTGDNGSVGLGTIDTKWTSLGDVAIAGGQLALDVNQTSFGPFSISPQPLYGTRVASVQADNIAMKNTRLTTSMPAVLGLKIPIPNPMGASSIDADDVAIGNFSTRGIMIPPLSFRDMHASNVSMDTAESDGFEADASFSEATNWVNLEFVGFRLRTDITTSLKASKIKMNGLKGDVSVGSADTSGFTMAMTLEGVDVAGLQINQVKAPTLDLEL